MADISKFESLVERDHGLAVVSVVVGDVAHASVTNAGVLAHPVSGERVVGIVARGDARKLKHLRANPHATVTLRAGWEWAAVEGTVELAGPDDELRGVDSERLRLLLREIFAAAGGTHDDWDTYDRVMRDEGRTAILVTPVRAYTNP